MFAVVVILIFLSILLGMAISVKAFGTGGKRAKIFNNIYFSVEDAEGKGVVYTMSGDYSCIISLENPIAKYSADTDKYYNFVTLMSSIMESLGDGYAIQKQDIFVRKHFRMSSLLSKDASRGAESKHFLSNCYFRFFDGRPYVEQKTYLIVTQKGRQGGFKTYDASRYKDFFVKVNKVYDRLKINQINCHFLDSKACQDYTDRYLAQDFGHENYSLSDFYVGKEEIGMGDRHMKVYSLLDIDDVGLPANLRPYSVMAINNIVSSEDLLSGLDHVVDTDTVVYNQVFFVPNQRKVMAHLDKEMNHHASIPNPSNQICVDDIKAVKEEIARNGRHLVWAHFSLVVTADADKDFHKITNYLENTLAKNNMHLSKRTDNQKELFVCSFPGNCFQTNEEYDRFLTLSEPAFCLMYKERQTHGDKTPIKCYYTDRQGLPMPIDLTGKEGDIKYTNNSNFFVLGPSGSGKSFFMNTVMRQYYEQNTDIVIVDTGDSYEGLCSYFNGTYITYSKDHPISMNPFKITEEEYKGNFLEKKNFLKSLIFLIFKGTSLPTKLEDVIINQTIIDYYEAYFHPFNGFSEEERKNMRDILLLDDKKNGKYEKFEEEMEERYGDDYELDDLTKKGDKQNSISEREQRLKGKLQAVIDDKASTDGEKVAAKNQLMKLTPEVIENHYLQRIERRIAKIEHQKKNMKVTELSFNSYYEFALERIPQIMAQQHVDFAINNFATILKPFYKGGEKEYTLNNDMDTSLFDEKFIVFEIDKIKDDPVLFPIIVLIIMDVFTQKMRLKKGRKCLVIEEAWKAIATPIMAEYIKYLYKTARKHWAMVGVVTQEIEDITSSPIVKEAIISNSDVFMLLDQSKFMDKFDEIKATLALSDIDCKKIFTINRLDNHDGRSPFKEVFIKRGTTGEVFGVEEPPECYMSYTTEKVEKEALKLYKRQLHTDHAHAVEAFVRDWQRSGIKKSIDFAKKVIKEGRVLNINK